MNQNTTDLASFSPPRLPYHPMIEERFGVDRAGWKTLTDILYRNASSPDSVVLVLAYCQARKFDPMKRPVHIVPIWDKERKCMVDTVWPGIGELRTTAFRTGQYAGRDEAEFGDTLEMPFGDGRLRYPEWCRVTLYRMVHGQRIAFTGPNVYWLETYATARRDSDIPNEMWATRPFGQLEKCFDPETEVLTDQGFQAFPFVTGRIMQVSGGRLEPTDSAAFSRPYAGRMIGCHGQALNFMVTPNHDLITLAGKVEARVVFDDATTVDGATIPLTVSGGGDGPEAPVTDGQLTLAAAIVCDGSRNGRQWVIGVSRPRKVAELSALNMHRRRYTRACAGDEAAAGGRIITTRADKEMFVYDATATGGVLADEGKRLRPEAVLSLSRRQARVLVDAILRFDGSTSRTARRFYASNPQTLGMFELAACIAGYSVSFRRERTGDIGGRNWCITVSTKEQAKVFRASRSQGHPNGGMVEEPNTSGEVWCCRVPSGVIVVRRKGLSMLCGNCAEAAALRATFPEEIGSGDYIPEEVERQAGPGEPDSATMAADAQAAINDLPKPRPSAATARATPTPENERQDDPEPAEPGGEKPQAHGTEADDGRKNARVVEDKPADTIFHGHDQPAVGARPWQKR